MYNTRTIQLRKIKKGISLEAYCTHYKNEISHINMSIGMLPFHIINISGNICQQYLVKEKLQESISFC